MDTKDKILWDKLNIDLELLTVSDPNSIIPLILDIHHLLFDQDDINTALRKINFMSYELQNRCEHLTEVDRQTILSDYLFNEKSFLITNLSSQTIDENDYNTIKNTFLVKKTSLVSDAIKTNNLKDQPILT